MTIHEFLQGDKFALLAGVELTETGNGYMQKPGWKSNLSI